MIAVLIVIICLAISGTLFDSDYLFLGVNQAGWLAIVFGSSFLYSIVVVLAEKEKNDATSQS